MKMMNNQIVSHRDCKCLEWKPIVAGALVIIGLTFLLNLFSVAIGLTAFTTNSDGVENLALGGLVGVAIGIVAAMFGAGWLTGYLSQRHCTKRHLGALYGFLAWCVAFLICIFAASHMHDYVNFYTHFLSGTEVVQIQGNAANNVAVTATTETKNVVISTYIVFS
jgi:MFS family permease